MKSKKSQAAMEFLMTYGWAILAAIIAISVLWYFGVFDNENWFEPEYNISMEECENESIIPPGNYDEIEENDDYIERRNQEISNLKIDYIWMECKIPDNIKQILINHEDLPNQNILLNYKEECIVILLGIRDNLNRIKIVKRLNKDLLKPQTIQTCKKVEVEEIELKREDLKSDFKVNGKADVIKELINKYKNRS